MKICKCGLASWLILHVLCVVSSNCLDCSHNQPFIYSLDNETRCVPCLLRFHHSVDNILSLLETMGIGHGILSNRSRMAAEYVSADLSDLKVGSHGLRKAQIIYAIDGQTNANRVKRKLFQALRSISSVARINSVCQKIINIVAMD